MNNSGQGDKSFLEQANALIRPNCLPHHQGGKNELITVCSLLIDD